MREQKEQAERLVVQMLSTFKMGDLIREYEQES
jgi:hypothetical protein